MADTRAQNRLRELRRRQAERRLRELKERRAAAPPEAPEVVAADRGQAADLAISRNLSGAAIDPENPPSEFFAMGRTEGGGLVVDLRAGKITGEEPGRPSLVPTALRAVTDAARGVASFPLDVLGAEETAASVRDFIPHIVTDRPSEIASDVARFAVPGAAGVKAGVALTRGLPAAVRAGAGALGAGAADALVAIPNRDPSLGNIVGGPTAINPGDPAAVQRLKIAAESPVAQTAVGVGSQLLVRPARAAGRQVGNLFRGFGRGGREEIVRDIIASNAADIPRAIGRLQFAGTAGRPGLGLSVGAIADDTGLRSLEMSRSLPAIQEARAALEGNLRGAVAPLGAGGDPAAFTLRLRREGEAATGLVSEAVDELGRAGNLATGKAIRAAISERQAPFVAEVAKTNAELEHVARGSEGMIVDTAAILGFIEERLKKVKGADLRGVLLTTRDDLFIPQLPEAKGARVLDTTVAGTMEARKAIGRALRRTGIDRLGRGQQRQLIAVRDAIDEQLKITQPEFGRAIAASRQARSDLDVFNEGAPGTITEKDRFGERFIIADEDVPRQFIRGNASESVRAPEELISAVGDRAAAAELLRPALSSRITRNANGEISSESLQRFRKNNQGLFDAFPELDSTFVALGGRVGGVELFNRSAMRGFIDDPAKRIRQVFDTTNIETRQQFAELVRRSKADPDAILGLRKIAIEDIDRRLKAGATPSNARLFDALVERNTEEFKALFGADGLAVLQDVAEGMRLSLRPSGVAAPNVEELIKANQGLAVTIAQVTGAGLGGVFSRALTGSTSLIAQSRGSTVAQSALKGRTAQTIEIFEEALLNRDITLRMLETANLPNIRRFVDEFGPVSALANNLGVLAEPSANENSRAAQR